MSLIISAFAAVSYKLQLVVDYLTARTSPEQSRTESDNASRPGSLGIACTRIVIVISALIVPVISSVVYFLTFASLIANAALGEVEDARHIQKLHYLLRASDGHRPEDLVHLVQTLRLQCGLQRRVESVKHVPAHLQRLAHFLDRFVYKNAKKPKPKGSIAMQPAAAASDGASGVKLLKGEVDEGVGPVNDEKWWKRKAEDVPVDQVRQVCE